MSVTLGNDLANLVPEELVRLRDPRRRPAFFQDYMDGRLMQYHLAGEEHAGKGAIVFCEDGSGTMKGARELWAKAIGLCFLHYAKQEGRAFHAIHFGNRDEIIEISFVDAEDFTTERILEYVELFFNGGTDFERPLGVALTHLQDEHQRTGRVEGDIVFCTDGLCSVGTAWMADFNAEQERLGFNVWGISIGATKDGEPLATICDGHVATVQDLTGGGDVQGVFAGVSSHIATLNLTSENEAVSETTP